MGILIFLSAVILSLLIVRVATVALTLTGLSRDLARFEARSAFTGAGFTTRDSEKVVSHPVRRQIIMLLMLLGNAGIVTAISSLVLQFNGPQVHLWLKIAGLLVGLGLLWLIAHSKFIDNQLSIIITWALRRFTKIDVNDYVDLLHLGDGFAVVEMNVNEGNWLANSSLMQLRLSDEGVLVLGVQRKDGTYVGAPKGKTELRVGDTLLIYGPHGTLDELDRRPADWTGDRSHKKAVELQQEHVEKADAVHKS